MAVVAWAEGIGNREGGREVFERLVLGWPSPPDALQKGRGGGI